MARAAATGTRLGPLVRLLHLHGCGAGSSEGTGSAAGWRPPSPSGSAVSALGRYQFFVDRLPLNWPARSPGRGAVRAFAREPGQPPERPEVSPTRLRSQSSVSTCQIDGGRKLAIPGGGRAFRTTGAELRPRGYRAESNVLIFEHATYLSWCPHFAHFCEGAHFVTFCPKRSVESDSRRCAFSGARLKMARHLASPHNDGRNKNVSRESL